MHTIEVNFSHAPTTAHQFAHDLPEAAEFFAKYAPHHVYRKVAARQLIWAEGDIHRDVFLVRSGAVCFSKMLLDGRRVVTGFAYAGDIFGLGSGPYIQNAEAVQSCALEGITMPVFERACSADPALASFVNKRISKELASAYQHMMVLTKLTASERLAHFLVGLSKRNRHVDSTHSVTIPMRRIDIADHLGLTIETISRTFTQFKNAGLITMEDPCVVVLINPDELATLANGTNHEEGSVGLCRRAAA